MINYKLSSKSQNRIIFFFVAFLAIQGFSLVEIYKINYPYAYDMTSMTIFIDYMYADGDYTIQEFFDELLADTNSRGIIFPKLVVSPNYILNNFDSGNIFYLNWIIISLTLTMFFLILRNNNPKLYWTLIPISAFLFSPLINNNYWNYTITIWYLAGFCTVSAVYFLNKNHTIRNTIGVIIFSIIATYSIPLGLPVWIIGSLTMFRSYIHKKIWTRKIPIIYFSIMTIIGIIYYTGNVSSQAFISTENLMSIDSLTVFATFLAVPYKLKFPELMIIVGTASICISIFVAYHLGINRKKIDEIFPWVLFLIISGSAAIIMRIGRFDPYFEGNLPYYTPIAGLFQIGLCLLIAILILDIKKHVVLKRKQLLLFFLYSIIILQIIFLVPSYYSGWWKADYYYNEKIEHLKCVSLYHDWDNCHVLYESSLDKSESVYDDFRVLNYFIKNNSNLFSERPNFNQDVIHELENFSIKLENQQVQIIDGKISYVNYIDVKEKNKVNVYDESLIISGLIDEVDVDQIEVLYLLVNDIPTAKFDNFYLTSNTQIEWTFAVLKNYLPAGCNTITVVGLINNNPFILNNDIEVCT